MSERTLEKILGRRAETGPDPDLPPPSDATDDHGCFGWLRGVKERSLMLELRKKTGQIKAFGYAWLELVEFDPSDGIALYFPGHIIKVKGSNLNSPISPDRSQINLFAGLLRHRVPWIREGEKTPKEIGNPQNCVVLIERIEW